MTKEECIVKDSLFETMPMNFYVAPAGRVEEIKSYNNEEIPAITLVPTEPP